MATKFAISRDANGFLSYVLPFSDTRYSVTLTASSTTSLTVPASLEKGVAVFSYTPGGNVWVANNATAAVPAGASFAATTSVLNPVAKEVKGADVLSFISPDSDIDVGVEFYAME